MDIHILQETSEATRLVSKSCLSSTLICCIPVSENCFFATENKAQRPSIIRQCVKATTVRACLLDSQHSGTRGAQDRNSTASKKCHCSWETPLSILRFRDVSCPLICLEQKPHRRLLPLQLPLEPGLLARARSVFAPGFEVAPEVVAVNLPPSLSYSVGLQVWLSGPSALIPHNMRVQR